MTASRFRFPTALQHAGTGTGTSIGEPAREAIKERAPAHMAMLGATLERVGSGEIQIRLPFREDLTQQHGFLHAGVLTSIADSACGYAALTLMPAAAAVLTVEFKVNLLAPGEGDEMLARARVLKAGRTLTICSGDVFALRGGEEKLVATMLATVMTVRDRPGLAD